MSQWPSSLTITDIQQSFRDVWRSIDSIQKTNYDLAGKKFVNVGDAVTAREFLTLGQGDRKYARIESLDQILTASEIRAVRIDTYALRGPASGNRYTVFEASDRNYVAWASDGTSWIYAYGIHSRLQSELAALAATLGTTDAGYLVWVTDFEHLLRWSGSAWTFGPGDGGGGYISFFTAAPPGNGWILVDGTATTYLNADGTTTAITPYDVSTMMLPYLRR